MLVALTLASARLASAPADPTRSFMVTGSNVDCRTKPSRSAPVVRRLLIGEIVQATRSQTGEHWLSVALADGSAQTCWAQGSAIVFDPTKPEGALSVLAGAAVERKDSLSFEEYARVERILASSKYSQVLSSSGRLQFRLLQVVDRAVHSEGMLTSDVEKSPAKKRWIQAHEDVLSVSELSASWYVPAAEYWSLYERYIGEPWTDELAWVASQHTPPTDECMSDCVLDADIIQGPMQYWSRLPRGQYVKEALRSAIERATYAADMACWDRGFGPPDAPSDSPVPPESLRTIRESLNAVTVPEKRDLLAQLDIAEQRCADFMPRRGMTRAEAERELGAPLEASTRREGTLDVETAVFADGTRRIRMDFVEGILVRYSVVSPNP